jgi:hypothetical protein
MQWQDIVLACGSVTFTLALIPSIRSKHKPALATSILTFLVLVVVTCTYASLSLWFAAVSAFINGAAWLTLVIQKYQQLQK